MMSHVANIDLAQERARAEEWKKKAAEKLGELCEIADAINKAGFLLEFNMGPDMIGRNRINQLRIIKVY